MAHEIADELARRLICIYSERKIPRYAEIHRSNPEGFTLERMHGHPESLFQMIILAAYDRQPFTWIAKGWEPIWGLADAGPSLPAVLREAGIFSLNSVLSLSHKEIEMRLQKYLFFKYRLDSDGAHTSYAKTFKDASVQVSDGLLSLMESATVRENVETIHSRLVRIHGIGPTIASKIVMYTLREIRLSGINPRELYPAVKPILTEYHNARFSKELVKVYGIRDLVNKVFEALVEMGDPFAIDALYYVDRDEPQLKRLLIQGMQAWHSEQFSREMEAQLPSGRGVELKPSRKVQAPRWGENEFEAVLNGHGLSDEELARKLPRRSPGAIGFVRSGIHGFHNRGPEVAEKQGILSQMMIDYLDKKRGSLVCPVCGERF